MKNFISTHWNQIAYFGIAKKTITFEQGCIGKVDRTIGCIKNIKKNKNIYEQHIRMNW